jgi:hypothetical protein
MMAALLAVDLLACATNMVVCGWLLTDRGLSRFPRVGCALLVAGSCVNVIGIYGMLASVDGFFYGDVWPSEVLVDVGVAALMLRWAWRRHAAAAEPACSCSPVLAAGAERLRPHRCAESAHGAAMLRALGESSGVSTMGARPWCP